METKNIALRIAGCIFLIVSVLHLLRIITGVPVVVAGWLMPVWMNWCGFFATGFLFGWLWWLSFRKPDNSSQYITERHSNY